MCNCKVDHILNKRHDIKKMSLKANAYRKQQFQNIQMKCYDLATTTLKIEAATIRTTTIRTTNNHPHQWKKKNCQRYQFDKKKDRREGYTDLIFS